ncbi:MAG: N-acetylneuraminate synthase family protein [Clostridiales bacterium]|nr:N-acetylneuraminate synthase family protein [Clostridiales bacterium]
MAEMNTSHFGNIETAKKMIDTAKEIGCDCVKFQSFSAQTLYSKSFYAENRFAQRFVQRYSLSFEEQKTLAEYCASRGIAFASTPYSRDEVDFLINECNVPFIKVASMDLNNYPYLEYIAKTGVPIILATGMSEIEEIEKAVETIAATGNNNVCLLHCISIYPPKLSTIHLNNIIGLKKKFPQYPIGFSDHSLGTEMDSAAIALGACLIEKHFTLDKTKIGMDNEMALEPEEYGNMIRQCLNVHVALGSEERVVSEAELNQRLKMRRSVVATRDLKAGDIITEGDLDVKRPGTGMPPEMMTKLIGTVVKEDVECDTLL